MVDKKHYRVLGLCPRGNLMVLDSVAGREASVSYYKGVIKGQPTPLAGSSFYLSLFSAKVQLRYERKLGGVLSGMVHINTRRFMVVPAMSEVWDKELYKRMKNKLERPWVRLVKG